jgi:hypothetical protein
MKMPLLLSLLLYTTTIFAQQKQKINGVYSMVLPRHLSMEQAEQKCIEQARLQALGNAFGYRVSEVTVNRVKESNRTMQEDFQTIAQTQVQGEWISDTEPPKVQWSCNNNQLSISTQVMGEALGFPDGGKLQWSLNTCAYADCANPNSQFKNGNNLFLQLQASESGFVNVYYWDHNAHEMLRLFPGAQHNEMKGVKIKADQSYTLFHQPSPFSDHPQMLDLQLTISNDKDNTQTDEIIVIYSKKEIQKPLLQMKDGLYSTDEKSFLQWKSNIYSKDNLVDVQMIPVTIVR